MGAMAVALFTLPQTLDVDAILVLPGMGEWERLRTAIAAWNANPRIRYLLVAGHTKTEDDYAALTVDYLVAHFGLTRREGVIIEQHAWSTKDQSDWLVSLVQDAGLGITSLALCAPSYHLLRAYLTMLKAFSRFGVPFIPMVPMPVPVSPETVSPLGHAKFWDLMQGEFNRIPTYQKKGHVATLEELREYIDAMWRTFPPLIAAAQAVKG